MSHPSQLDFVASVRKTLIPEVTEIRILEVGSYDVNGSIRSLFEGCRSYVGSDLAAGPGVDVVCAGQDLNFPDGYFDLTISCECFEHNPRWVETFANMVRMTRAGGIVVVTCASRGRLEHGTTRTNPNVSPGTQAIGVDYYKNLTERDFIKNFDLCKHFQSSEFFYIPRIGDLYFVGLTKNIIPTGKNLAPIKFEVERIRRSVKFEQRGIRHILFLIHTHYPLQFLSYLLPDSIYRDVSFHYVSLKTQIKNAFTHLNSK